MLWSTKLVLGGSGSHAAVTKDISDPQLAAMFHCPKLAVTGALPTDTCSIPPNPDPYPNCNSEVTVLHAGKHHWVET